MENNENFVTEEVAENVEHTTEETPQPKMYTEDEFNDAVNKATAKRTARKEAKIRREYEKKYGELESVLRAGTGKENVEDITSTFADFYKDKGVKLSKKSSFSDGDIAVLAAADADDIIDAGYEEVVEEVDRLASIGAENMTPREQAVFKRLAEHRKKTEETRELKKLGVTKDVYESEDFKNFAKKFNPGTSIAEVYDIYNKTQPKKEFKTAGSMKQSQAEKIKDYYSPEEISRLSANDLKDPNVWATVRRSMTGG